ncbi:transglycosylase domain-containing protein [Streptomyces sp. LP05-1]|uniref:Transglycosylase domain-containing protein n=1 Tax=Streptomyces pyxinae TaxID=2970734 RepID=A0ABT2CCZ0_9ACTN|nr:transglycosylase domain-containing protein [Streptomyces sp. LP05-1]MCS0635190.1 transglycosylase domain-containing protein [Streptomyces sp. LP05-1]
MSEHRRKPPQPQGGGRAAARRAAQQSPGHRAEQARGVNSGSPAGPYGEERPYGGRAEARRAAQRGGGRRAGAAGGAGGHGGGRRGGAGHGGGPGDGPGKKRIIDYPRSGKHGWRRWTPSWKLVTGVFLGFAALLMGAATVAYAWVEIPDPAKIAKAQNNVYYWADGSQMAATGGEINRQILAYDAIPAEMRYAVMSAENKSFETDWGVDPSGIGRAVVNMAMGGQTQGGSTITQQYVKNAMLDDQSQTLSRKAKELFIALKVGTKGSKEKTMAGYLNTSYYGRGAYGLQAAARTYFNKDAKDLNASECAFLASLLKGATYYDPAGATEIDPTATPQANADRATKRWKWILDEMVKDGHLDAAKRAGFTAFPKVVPPKKGAQLSGQTGYLVDLAKAYFINNNEQGITAKQLAQGGYEIHTTFDKKNVEQLQAAVKKVYDANIDPQKRPKTDTHVQFGGASVNPENGAITAIYGGADATKHFTNNADQTGAQVGSTFKPFVLAAAMRDGVRNPALGSEQGPSERRIVDPDRAFYNGQNKLKIRRYDGSVWKDENGNEWLQTNDGQEDYKNISLREAMIHSANSPFVQLGMDIGIDKVRQAAIDSGLRKESLVEADVPSFSIGISDPSAIRMAGAYATFAANGERNEPYSVTKVLKSGKEIYTHQDKGARAFDTAVASNVTDVLRSVVEDPEGTGRKAALPGRQVAGKTGTTDGNKSAWFVGYTPQLSTAIDMYRMDDDATNKNRKFEEMFGTGGQKKIHGSSFPSEIWREYMSTALEGKEKLRFPEPEPLDAGAVFGGGAESPKPKPSASPSKSASPSPSSPSPSKSQSSSPSPSTSSKASCPPYEWDCDEENGGGDNSGQVNGGNGNPAGGGTIQGGDTQGTGNPTGGGAVEGGDNSGNVNGGNPAGGSANSGAANGETDGGRPGGGWISGMEG